MAEGAQRLRLPPEDCDLATATLALRRERRRETRCRRGAGRFFLRGAWIAELLDMLGRKQLANGAGGEMNLFRNER